MFTQEIIVEVCNRPTSNLELPYARAFLDGRPEPTQASDVDRLVRLMAYDLVCESGHRGSDPAGIYAMALSIIHAIQGGGNVAWEWVWQDLNFKCAPCDQQVFFPPKQPVVENNSDPLPSMSDWRTSLEDRKIPDFAAPVIWQRKISYPDPMQALLAASLLALSVARDLINPGKVSIWFDKSPEKCILIELWSSKDAILST